MMMSLVLLLACAIGAQAALVATVTNVLPQTAESVGPLTAVTLLAQFSTCAHLANHTVELDWGDTTTPSKFFIPALTTPTPGNPVVIKATDAEDKSTLSVLSVMPTPNLINPITYRNDDGNGVLPGVCVGAFIDYRVDFIGHPLIPNALADGSQQVVTTQEQRMESANGFYSVSLAEAGSAAFNFEFHCKTYTSVKVSRNGVLTFMSHEDLDMLFDTSTATGAVNKMTGVDNEALPDTGIFTLDNFIAPNWADAAPGATENDVKYRTIGNVGDRVFVVQWNNNGANVFQVRLFERDNSIEFDYQGAVPIAGPAVVVGVESDTGVFFAPTVNNGCSRMVQAPKLTTFSATHVYQDDNPTGTASDVNTIKVTVTDSSTPALVATTNSTITILNVAPAPIALVSVKDDKNVALAALPPNAFGPVFGAAATGPGALHEGTAVALELSSMDASPLDTLLVDVVWGDGTPSERFTFDSKPGNTLIKLDNIKHTYVKDGSYQVVVRLADDDLGNGNRQQLTINVLNACPVLKIEGLVLTGGANGELVATVTDAGIEDVITIAVTWDSANANSPVDRIVLDCGVNGNARCDGDKRSFTIKYNFPDKETAVAETTKQFLVTVVASDEACPNQKQVIAHVPFQNNKALLQLTAESQFVRGDNDDVENAIVTLTLHNSNTRNIDVANVNVDIELLGNGLAQLVGGRAVGSNGKALWKIDRLAGGAKATQQIVIAHRQHDEFEVKASINAKTVITCITTDIACDGFPLNASGSNIKIAAKYNARVHP